MRTSELDEMRRLPLFAETAPERVEAMLRASFLQRFPAHVDLVREGEPADFLHVVVDGQVELFTGYRDREKTVSVIGPGHTFIVAAVVLDRVYLKSARSLTSARILMVPSDAVRLHFDADAGFSRALAFELAVAYRSVVKELKNQKLRSSLERLANWLIAHGAETGGTGKFKLPFETKILASRIGMAPEVLSRSFASLAAYGVKVDGASIEIGDRATLTRLAKPSPTIDDPRS